MSTAAALPIVEVDNLRLPDLFKNREKRMSVADRGWAQDGQAEPSRRDRSDAAPHRTRMSRAALIFRPVLLLAGCGLVLCSAIAGGTAVLVSSHNDRMVADKERELRNLARIVADHVDRAFQAISHIETGLIAEMRAHGIASADDFEREMSGYDTYVMLRNKIAGVPHADALSVISAKGKTINHSRAWPPLDLDSSDREFFKALKSDPQLTTYTSGLVRNLTNGNWTIHIVSRFTAPNGEFLGVVLGAIEMQYFEQYFSTIALGDGGIISLVGRDGVLLARYPSDESRIGVSYANNKLFKDVLSKAAAGATRLTSIRDGEEYLYAGQSLANYPAVVAVGIKVDSVLAEWRASALYLNGAAILLVLVVGGTILLSARQVEKQLGAQNLRMDAAIKNMTQGLVMFDGGGRVILYNDRYLQIYGLSRGIVQPGCTIRDLLAARKAAGTFMEDPDRHVSVITQRVASGQTTTTLVELGDGRSISVVTQPIAGGGWVATHDDITDVIRHERSFRLLFESNPLPMYLYDLENLRFLAVNDAAVAHYGYSREQFLQMTGCDIRPEEDRERFVKSVRENGGYHQREGSWRHRKADGTLIDVAIYSRALDYEGRRAALVVAIDMTERKEAERKRALAEKFLHAVIDNVPISVSVKDVDRRYVLINRAAEEFSGIPREQFIGKTAAEIFPKRSADLIERQDRQLLEGKPQIAGEIHELAIPNDSSRLVMTKRVAILGDDGNPQYLVGVIEDLTERARTQAQIAHMAHYDLVTDLPNRVLLGERLDAALAHVRRGRRLAVHCLDLDNFKTINDTLGHASGDELLKVIGQRLQGCLRDIDTVARLGGDEFAIVQTSLADIADAGELAQRLRETICMPYELNGQQVVVDASIGIAVAPEDGTDAGELLKKADLALYGAKSEGRGTYRFFEPDMDRRMKARLFMHHDLRKAFADGEFALHYQPIVKVSTNEICCLEALLRWHHPVRGVISPAEFIPIAEEMGLIVPLGEWVVRKACADAASWPSDCCVAVNVSAAQFKNLDILRVVTSALADSQLPPSRLELEITEAVLLQNNTRTLAILHELHELGVRIALDDFGTGYSSLSYLRSFPFDKIKIDRSFIGDLTAGDDSHAIVRTIIELARSLDMSTTAEGIETLNQMEIAKELGCTEMQGYLFDHARPAEEISWLLAQRDRWVA
jgi:diguanylate cyclase (GGDEF)-like protein/PAS domain S-box-containing protein